MYIEYYNLTVGGWIHKPVQKIIAIFFILSIVGMNVKRERSVIKPREVSMLSLSHTHFNTGCLATETLHHFFLY